jgi:hypothetical protein
MKKKVKWQTEKNKRSREGTERKLRGKYIFPKDKIEAMKKAKKKKVKDEA